MCYYFEREVSELNSGIQYSRDLIPQAEGEPIVYPPMCRCLKECVRVLVCNVREVQSQCYGQSVVNKVNFLLVP